MKPVFRTDRERLNFLSYEEYEDDYSIFCFHSQIELYFVNEGEMDITVNDNHQILKSGEMAAVLSFDAHTYMTPEKSRSSALFIPVHLCPDFIEEVRHKRATSPFICNKKVVENIKNYVSELQKSDDNSVLRQGYIYVILGIIKDNIFFESTKENMDPELSTRLLSYINDNFNENINLSTVAKELGYNESYLSRYFKSCFRIGFNRYLATVRLKNALMLMSEKKYTTAYCAMEVGFNSMRTFYRAFQKEFGCTPKEYIKKQTAFDKM